MQRRSRLVPSSAGTAARYACASSAGKAARQTRSRSGCAATGPVCGRAARAGGVLVASQPPGGQAAPVSPAAGRGRGPGVGGDGPAALVRGRGAAVALVPQRPGLAVGVEDAGGGVAVADEVDDEPVQPVAVCGAAAAGGIRVHHDERPERIHGPLRRGRRPCDLRLSCCYRREQFDPVGPGCVAAVAEGSGADQSVGETWAVTLSSRSAD